MYQGTRPPVVRGTTWSDSIQCFDDGDNTPIDLSQATEIIVEIIDCGRPVVTGRLSDGSIYLGDTTGVFSFDLAIPTCICPKTYDFGCNLTLDGKIVPVAVGTIPIIDGHIR
jgi:hypothetical protein